MCWPSRSYDQRRDEDAEKDRRLTPQFIVSAQAKARVARTMLHGVGLHRLSERIPRLDERRF